jgi:RNA polymerase sigma-70 factor (ECF subfamily)
MDRKLEGIEMAEINIVEDVLREYYAQQRSIYGYIYSATRDYHATQDIFQEVAIAITRKAHTYDTSRPPLPWFFGIARYEILSWLRARGKKPVHVSFDVLNECFGEEDRAHAGTTEVSLREQALKSCIEKLPPKQRSIIDLRYSEKLSCDRIAESVNQSIQSIYAIVKRLKISLRDCVTTRLEQELS